MANNNNDNVGKHPPSSMGNSDNEGKTALTFTVVNEVGVLEKILGIFSKNKIDLSKIESRPAKNAELESYDFYVEINNASESGTNTNKCLEDLNKSCKSVQLLGSLEQATVPFFPTTIQDLDKFAHKVLEYGEELDSNHPGFTDEEYRRRRLDITYIAKNYKHGQQIPRIEYTEQEIQTWGTVYRKLKELYPTHACKQFNHIFPLLEQNCGYGEDSIPQLQDVSDFLKQCTGWTLRPVSGLLSPRDFLNGLAFRVFHSTQYIRHHSKPFYTPEPDVCHELLGHVPLFADPSFALFSQEIGLASLGASEEDIEKLATCYWFTIEFGLCKEGEKVKAFGAGLLSSFGELEYCLSDEPDTKSFEPFSCVKTKYPITEYQPLYFVADSFQSATNKIKKFAKSLDRPFSLYYDPYCQRVEILDTKSSISKYARSILTNMNTLIAALET